MNPPRFQFRIFDMLLLTAAVAGVVFGVVSVAWEISFATVACLLLFVWHRPILLRFWTVGMIGLGAFYLGSGLHGIHRMRHLPDGELFGWGLGMLVAGIAGFVVFAVLPPR